MEPVADHNTASANTTRAEAVVDGARVDLAVLPADRLLEPSRDDVGDSLDLAALGEDSYPSFHDDDLPAPAFHDADLPAPSFHDDDLPAPSFLDDDLPAPSVHADDLPADLTNFGLGRLLGLQLSSAALPTVGEVTRTVAQSVETIESEPEDDEAVKEDADKPDSETDPANPNFTDAGDLSFIDPQPLTEKAETNSTTSVSEEEFEAELFGLGLSSDEGGLSDDFTDPGGAEILPPAEGSGGGTNVINGSAGDDVLNGTAGGDLIHGFAGNDVLDGGAGSDRLDGGLGDDVLVWDSVDTRIDGQGGTDTLRVDNGDIDFTTFGGTIAGLEIIDLQSDAGANAVTLVAQDVLDATDNGNTLTLTGDMGDSLDASNGWTDGGFDGDGNQIYTQAVGGLTATLVVDPDINVNANILM
ncbi:MAG: hypothetical protein GKS02_11665 [Alphaproteobacteria bacterium]|nr:hypothetical protein [Alphaproteobacteria bacterium]